MPAEKTKKLLEGHSLPALFPEAGEPVQDEHQHPPCTSTCSPTSRESAEEFAYPRAFPQVPRPIACARLAPEELLVVFAENLCGEQLQQREARQREREPIKGPLSRKLHPDQGEEG
jgi:hypothetical protein